MLHNINVSCVHNQLVLYVYTDRLISSKFYELILQNVIQQIIELQYKKNLHQHHLNYYYNIIWILNIESVIQIQSTDKKN